ncbi:amidohydrolase family protein [Hydrogenoanaerobacterium sp.]|uniref:amidohydrolase family protein n=1 Tax=Hydrogenoanaerobacterium sp. TaxID=2953763 RepID=UPI00289E29AB|nr:amidohydrolase family protein [Hydrogenoanaerobacterium sp.]
MQIIHNGRILKITDAHTHIYPGKIAEKATASVGQFYGIGIERIGFPHALVQSGGKIGVAKYLVCSVATKPEQVRSINDFIFEKCQKYPQFLGFGALHPQQTDWEQEIERVCQMGLRGAKLHPDFQKFNIDDPRMIPVYRKIRDAGLPILFHMGDDRYDFSAPQRLCNVMQQLPDLVCIAAHFGGYQRWSDAAKYLLCDNVYFDTSSSLWKLTPDEAVGLIHHFGAAKLLFGTDFPMWDHATELDRFLKLNLTDKENDQILYQNFERLFQVTV